MDNPYQYDELKKLDAGAGPNIGKAFKGILMKMNNEGQLIDFINWMNDQPDLSPIIKDKVLQVTAEMGISSSDEPPSLVVTEN